MFKWMKRLDSLVRFLAAVARIIVAVLNALDPPNNHDNPVEKEANNRNTPEEPS